MLPVNGECNFIFFLFDHQHFLFAESRTGKEIPVNLVNILGFLQTLDEDLKGSAALQPSCRSAKVTLLSLGTHLFPSHIQTRQRSLSASDKWQEA